MTAILATKTIGVMGSGIDSHLDLAEPLGQLLARLGVNLLTGGGGGVMEAVARAFLQERPQCGISIGVLPCERDDPAQWPPGYPNAHVQLRISTHLPDSGRKGHLPSSRNHVNVLSSDVIIALPGSFGTASEVGLAVDYGKPIGLFGYDNVAAARVFPGVPCLSTLTDVESFLRSRLGAVSRGS